MAGINARRARRWFWTLLGIAVLAMGILYEALRATPGPGTGLLVATSALVLVAASAQAARILTVLGRPLRPQRTRTGAGKHGD